MSVFYNELDTYPAAWLRNLIAAGHLPDGEVDETTISWLDATKLPATAHFFAGIGGWPLALRMAGVPDDFPVWTGSCPCQPFSHAGSRGGFDDKRHLWPAWFSLIEKRRPPVVFGEQVASPDGLGWLDLVSTDLESAGYSVAAADLCAAGAGAPHIRQRLYFAAVTDEGRELLGGLADQQCSGRIARGRSGEAGDGRDPAREQSGRLRPVGGLADADGRNPRAGDPSGLGDPELAGLEGHPRDGNDGDQPGRLSSLEARSVAEAGSTRGFWADADWLFCRDGKYRPVEPGTFPLAFGLSGRVGKLRAYGNAIVIPLAATFVRATMEACR